MHLTICTDGHAREGEKHFAGWLELPQSHLGIGYFGGTGQGIEVEFEPCLFHCEQGFAVSVEDEVLEKAEDFVAFLDRLGHLVTENPVAHLSRASNC